MSNGSLGYSFIESTDKIKEKLKVKAKANAPVRPPSPIIEAFHGTPDLEPETQDEDGELANVSFTPPPKPESSGVQRTKKKEKALARNEHHPTESFAKMSDKFAKEYYEQYIPFSNPKVNTGQYENAVPNEDFEKKINYMIHLLEDQKDEKTEGKTEEIVLYCFLGVFIIFVLDSFAKVGKYVR
jgi:hypothetical protein|tara:strand:+ start:636 stop:1187 length:552 start_codon:yes stop_codon:yes gene_type:complete